MSAVDPRDRICIYCQSRGADKEFNREHIIPRSIGGGLFLDDIVCTPCNSRLGTKVDAEILRLPETLDAFAALSLAHDRDGILARHYQVVGEVDGAVVKGRLTRNGALFPTQELPDGSLLCPEDAIEGTVTRIASRRGIADSDVHAEVEKLRNSYRKAPRGSTVTSETLGIALRKRAGPKQVRVVPARKANPVPLIAKIVYEFLFLSIGKRLFLPGNEELGTALRDTIEQREGATAPILRLAPPGDAFEPFHVIDFTTSGSALMVRVILFGSIHFLMIHGPLAEGSLDELREISDPDATGVQYQQRLDRNAKAFWVNRGGRPGIRIG
ncbi:MAG: HNH endonuclease [Thermoanaerobaculaceae bacterium]